MGYKGTIRSIGTAIRAAEREEKKRQRELERQQKEMERREELERGQANVE